MEWLFDPTALAGLATLVLLEVVLGIDNLVFIAILSNKLPPAQRQRARMVGLLLALAVRIVLLFSVSWMVALTNPLFQVFNHDVSGRELILLSGGLFLLFKATVELHEKLEGVRKKNTGSIRYAKFWQVILQIVILDAVFSLDAVITAVGMANSLPVMVTAVCVAMGIMILASNRLMTFVSAFPTVIILCLGFLMMIGFSLVLEGVGYHFPKGYLYAAIGFSVLIEALNQTMQRNRDKAFAAIDPRSRVTDAVMSLIGGKSENEDVQDGVASLATKSHELDTFRPQERMMIQRVLRLSELSIEAVMTPRHDVYWIDLTDPSDTLRQEISDCPFSCMVVCEDNQIDNPLGIIHKKQLANLLLETPDATDFRQIVRQTLILPDTATALQAMESFQKNRQHTAFIVDEYGSFKGLITLTDIAEAIAGQLPGDHETDDFTYTVDADGSFILNGAMTIADMREIIYPIELPDGDYNTVAGIVLSTLRKIPQVGKTITLGNWQIRVEEMDKRRIKRLRFFNSPCDPADAPPHQARR